MKKHDVILYSGIVVIVVILMTIGFTNDGYIMGAVSVFFLVCAYMEDHYRNRRQKKHRKVTPSLFSRMKKQAQPTRN